MERFARDIVLALNQVLETPVETRELELPPDPAFGDFGFPCFRLSKVLRKAPPQIAADIAGRVASLLPPTIEVKAVGPYVNFIVKKDALVSQILGSVLAGDYGRATPMSRGTWVLEYSSPNVAKPLQIYHLRPTALGAALDRIGTYRGYKVTSINHLGDWGTQYGKLALAFRIFASEVQERPTMLELVDLYVRVHKVFEEKPELEDEAREAFLKLEQGDAEMTAFWKKCVDISLEYFQALYKRLGVRFDHYWGESFYQAQLEPLLQRLKADGVLVQSEGAWVVHVTDPQGKELPPCLLQKSDGATLYATRDVAAAIYRQKEFKFDRMTYIVGGEQKLHFEQVFGVLRKMGYDWVDRCEHVPTGLYRFRDAKMSTRKGNFVTLEAVLDEARSRVEELLTQRESTAVLSSEERGQIAEAVSIGAVVFHDLHTDPARDVEFDLEKVVSFEGETGPYLQYAHVRCASLLRRAHDEGVVTVTSDEALRAASAHLQAEQELALIRILGRFPLMLDRVLEHSKTSMLAHYLIEVAQAFGAFYRECPVMSAEEDVKKARLLLIESTRRVLAQGLGLLGVPIPARM